MDDGLTKAPGREGLTLERRRRGNWGKDGATVCWWGSGVGGAARAIIPLNKAMQAFC